MSATHLQNKTVLLVDDEVKVLDSLVLLLEDEDYRVLKAKSASEGLEILENEPIHLIISDHKMPQMTGMEFIEKVRSAYPDIICLMLTAYDNLYRIKTSKLIDRLIPKPWDPEELINTIHEYLSLYDRLLEIRQIKAASKG